MAGVQDRQNMEGHLLELAVKARVPVITCTTSDELHLQFVLDAMFGEEVTPYEEIGIQRKLCENTVYYVTDYQNKEDWVSLYKKFNQIDSTLILVNTSDAPEVALNTGEIIPPKKTIQEFLCPPLDPEVVATVMPSLGGLSIKEVVDIIRITEVRDGLISPQGVMTTRKMYKKPVKGLSLVDPHMDFYMPNPDLKAFTEAEAPFFLNTTTDKRLMPRGLLMTGQPGTGKTLASKYISQQWEVPLYRLDSTIQSKWIGESESNLSAALKQVDMEEPCILLIDEVEKLFSQGNSSDSGVSSKLLGAILWWLQEHQSRVFVIMTSNAHHKLPPELYRPGRIDKVMEYSGFELSEDIYKFSEYMFGVFNIDMTSQQITEFVEAVRKDHYNNLGEVSPVAHSYVVGQVKKYVKLHMLNNEFVR